MEMPKTDEERRERERLERLEREGKIKLGSRVSEEFWQLPWPKDPGGLVRKALTEDREQGR